MPVAFAMNGDIPELKSLERDLADEGDSAQNDGQRYIDEAPHRKPESPARPRGSPINRL